MSRPGFRIFTRVERPAPEVVAAFSSLAAADVGDVMCAFNVMEAGLSSVVPGRFCGPAITVRVRAGDNLMVHKAIDLASPGDVLVIDGHGDADNALVGENIVLWAKHRGIVGIIVDGAVRDVDALQAAGLPVRARRITPAGTYKHGPGEVNVPVACGRVVVQPGDLVLGDADGVAVVPRRDVEAVLAGMPAKAATEASAHAGIARGDWVRPATTDAAVAALGCDIIDDVHRP